MQRATTEVLVADGKCWLAKIEKQTYNSAVSRLLISYSHTDTSFVVNLREALIEFGHNPWIDWTHVRDTSDWLNHVHTGIAQCTHFIFVASHHSLASVCCAKELEYALEPQQARCSSFTIAADGSATIGCDSTRARLSTSPIARSLTRRSMCCSRRSHLQASANW